MMTSSNGNIFRVTGSLCEEFTGDRRIPSQRPVTQSFDVLFDLRLNKRLNKQSWSWWFVTPSGSLWRHCNVLIKISRRIQWEENVNWIQNHNLEFDLGLQTYRVGLTPFTDWVGYIIMMTSSNGNIFRATGPLCGEFTGPGEFPTQRPVTRRFDVFFDLRLNKRLSKQPWDWWFETPSWSLWRQCNDSDSPGIMGIVWRMPWFGTRQHNSRMSVKCFWKHW